MFTCKGSLEACALLCVLVPSPMVCSYRAEKSLEELHHVNSRTPFPSARQYLAMIRASDAKVRHGKRNG